VPARPFVGNQHRLAAVRFGCGDVLFDDRARWRVVVRRMSQVGRRNMKMRAVLAAVAVLAVGGSAIGLAIGEEKSAAPAAAPASPAPPANSAATAKVPPPPAGPPSKPPQAATKQAATQQAATQQAATQQAATQQAATQQAATKQAATQQAATKLSPAELDQLLAPVALYPDQLLDQVLMASTYPLEVVEAARWVEAPAHRRLKGKALMAALKVKNWAPSVMALVPFPRLLETMNKKIRWTEDLGNAFLAQQPDVMASVQRLRHEALAAGSLDPTKCRCRVERRGEAIAIEPVHPAAVYVPICNPLVAYGPWPYPLYPPVLFPVPIGFIWEPVPFIGFYPFVSVAFYGPLWGWADFNWWQSDIIVNVAAYDVLTFGDPAFSGAVWVHDPAHRDGVAYADPAVAARFGNRAAAAARANVRSASLGAGGGTRGGWHQGGSGSTQHAGATQAAIGGGIHGRSGRGGRYHAAAGGWHHGGGFHAHTYSGHGHHSAAGVRYHGGGFHGGRGGFAMGGGFYGGGGHGGGGHGGGEHGGHH
jgi:Protein of unknown function (DUF3300)